MKKNERRGGQKKDKQLTSRILIVWQPIRNLDFWAF